MFNRAAPIKPFDSNSDTKTASTPKSFSSSKLSSSVSPIGDEVKASSQEVIYRKSLKSSSVHPIDTELDKDVISLKAAKSSTSKGEISPTSIAVEADDFNGENRNELNYLRKATISTKISEEAGCRRALSKLERKLGQNHNETIDAVHNLANVLRASGKILEAEGLYARELMWKETKLGREHQDTIAILHILGDVLISTKKYDDAGDKLVRALSFREKHSGSNHADTLEVVASLARLRSRQNRYSEAEQLFRRLLNWREGHLGADALPTLDTIQDLAQVLHSCGRYEDAIRLYQRALVGRKSVQGETAVQTLLAESRVASVLFDQSKLAEAEAHYRHVLAGFESSLGEHHVHTLDAVHAIAVVLDKSGQLVDAVEMFNRAVDGRERILGPDHPNTILSAEMLADLFDRLEDLNETPREPAAPKETADCSSIPTLTPLPTSTTTSTQPPLSQREIALVSKFVSSSDVEAKSTTTSLAALTDKLSSISCSALVDGWPHSFQESRIGGATAPSTLPFEEIGIQNAEMEYRQEFEAFLKAGAPMDNHILRTVGRLATVLHSQKKLKEAEPFYRRAIQMHDGVHGEVDDEASLEVLQGFVALLLQRRQVDEAQTFLTRVIRGSRTVFGPDHTNTLFAINVLAGVLRRDEKFAQAASVYDQALQGYERSLGPDHPFSLSTANDLAVQWCRQNKLEEAQQLLERTLIGREKALGVDHLDTLSVINNLALVLQVRNNIEYVEEMYERVLAGIDRRTSDKANELYVAVTANFANFYFSQNDSRHGFRLLKSLSDHKLRVAPKFTMKVISNAVKNLINLQHKDDNSSSEELHELISAFHSMSSLPVRDEFDEEETETVETAVALDNLPPFPKKGATLRLLRRIRELSEPHWTTTDVNENLVKPWTSDHRCSFADMMEDFSSEPHPLLGMTYDECFTATATVFVSHAWRYNFGDLVEAVETFFVDQIVVSGEHAGCTQAHRITALNTSLWLDLFVNDQWNAPSLPYEWWSSTFLSAIGDIGHTMLVLSPWNAPVPLTRAWCLWEILSTIRTKSTLTVQLSARHRRQFQAEYKKDENCLFAAFCKIDVAKSEAFKDADKNMIFQAVTRWEGGFRGVNNLIMERLRAWATRCLKEMVDDPFRSLDANGVKPSGANEKLEDVRNKVLLAGIYHTQYKVDDAEAMYKECIREMGVILRQDDPEFLQLKARLAALYRSQRRYLLARYLYDDIVYSFQMSLGNDHPDTLRMKSMQAKLYQNVGELVEAERMYVEILEKFRKLLPADHKDTLQTMHNLGSIYSDQGQYDDALMMFSATLDGYERGFGLDHPDTLRTVHCVGIVLQNQKKFVEADEHYTRALIGLERVLGPKHPDVIKVASNAAALRSYFFKNPFTNFSQNTVHA